MWLIKLADDWWEPCVCQLWHCLPSDCAEPKIIGYFFVSVCLLNSGLPKGGSPLTPPMENRTRNLRSVCVSRSTFTLSGCALLEWGCGCGWHLSRTDLWHQNPVQFPNISLGTRDIPISTVNITKVSNVCGHLICCNQCQLYPASTLTWSVCLDIKSIFTCWLFSVGFRGTPH